MELFRKFFEGDVQTIKYIMGQSRVPKFEHHPVCDTDAQISEGFIADPLPSLQEKTERIPDCLFTDDSEYMSPRKKMKLEDPVDENSHQGDAYDATSKASLYLDAENHDSNDFQSFLENDANTWDSQGLTPFTRALKRGHIEMAKKILLTSSESEQLSVIDSQDFSENSPLYLAIVNRCAEIMRILLDMGADVNVQNSEGMNPLHLIFKKQIPSIASIILSHEKLTGSLNVNLVDHLGNTPLHYAVKYNFDNHIESLLYHGADVSIENSEMLTPIHIAFERLNIKIVQSMATVDCSCYEKVNPTDSYGFSHFHAACMTDNITVVETFIQNGASINMPVSSYLHRTPLHLAVQETCANTVELLINHGADINARDSNGWTPLHMAVKYFDDRVMDLLLINGADIRARTKDGKTLLHLAVLNKQAKIVELFLNLGVDVDAPDATGSTALFYVDNNSNDGLMESLLKATTHIDLSYKNGETLLYRAIRYSKYNHISILLDRGVDINNVHASKHFTALHAAAEKKDFKLISLFLQNGVEVNRINRRGHTAFDTLILVQHGEDQNFDEARARNYRKIIRLMLEYGCKISDSSNTTPLQLAMANGSPNAVSALLQLGANASKIKKSKRGENNSIITRHTYKMKAIKFIESENRKESILEERLKRSFISDEFAQSCENELEKMKNTMILESLSLYDVIQMKPKRVFGYLDILKNVITTRDFDEDFPQFGFAVRMQIQRSFIVPAFGNMLDFFCSRGLPYQCGETIAKFLRDEEIIGFSRIIRDDDDVTSNVF